MVGEVREGARSQIFRDLVELRILLWIKWKTTGRFLEKTDNLSHVNRKKKGGLKIAKNLMKK